MFFNKKKDKSKYDNARRATIGLATLPLPALMAVPRSTAPNSQATADIPQARLFHSLPPMPSGKVGEDSDSSLPDYDQARETTPYYGTNGSSRLPSTSTERRGARHPTKDVDRDSNRRSVSAGIILGPPNDFRDAEKADFHSSVRNRAASQDDLYDDDVDEIEAVVATTTRSLGTSLPSSRDMSGYDDYGGRTNASNRSPVGTLKSLKSDGRGTATSFGKSSGNFSSNRNSPRGLAADTQRSTNLSNSAGGQDLLATNFSNSTESHDPYMESQVVGRTYSVPTYAAIPPASQSRESVLTRASSRFGEKEVKNLALLEQQMKLEQDLAAQDERFRQNKSQFMLEASQSFGSRTPQELSSMLIESQSFANLADQTLRVRDEMIKCLREQISHLQEENREIAEENDRLHRVNSARDDYDVSVASGPPRSRPQHDFKEETDTLKSLVVRLTAELDRYQRRFRKLSQNELDMEPGLPIRGPKPSWLVNTKCLAPLLVAYDDRLRDRDEILREYESEMDKFRLKVEEILRENDRLHKRLNQTNVVGPISNTEWATLQEQCKLVLEENQLLMDQLNVQQCKENDVQKKHIQEVARLSQRLNIAEAERDQYKAELSDRQTRLEILKRQYEEAVIDKRMSIPADEHIQTISELKQSLHEEKLKLAEEMSKVTTDLQVVEAEKKLLAKGIEKSKEVIRNLELEIKARVKAEKKSHRKIELLQITIDDMESVASKVKQYLYHVLQTADMTAKERDGLVQSVKDQETDRLKDLQKFVAETHGISKLQDQLKEYKARKKQKLDRLAHRLEEQGADFSLQREQYEKEMNHLRQLVRDRDDLVNVVSGEKREVLEDLETMWQVASKDNQRMQETIQRTGRRLQEHASLRARLPYEPDNDIDYIIQPFASEDDHNTIHVIAN